MVKLSPPAGRNINLVPGFCLDLLMGDRRGAIAFLSMSGCTPLIWHGLSIPCAMVNTLFHCAIELFWPNWGLFALCLKSFALSPDSPQFLLLGKVPQGVGRAHPSLRNTAEYPGFRSG